MATTPDRIDKPLVDHATFLERCTEHLHLRFEQYHMDQAGPSSLDSLYTVAQFVTWCAARNADDIDASRGQSRTSYRQRREAMKNAAEPTNIDLAEQRAAMAKMSRRPWEYLEHGQTIRFPNVQATARYLPVFLEYSRKDAEEQLVTDMRGIVAIVNAHEALLDEVERLRAENQSLRTPLGDGCLRCGTKLTEETAYPNAARIGLCSNCNNLALAEYVHGIHSGF